MIYKPLPTQATLWFYGALTSCRTYVYREEKKKTKTKTEEFYHHFLVGLFRKDHSADWVCLLRLHLCTAWPSLAFSLGCHIGETVSSVLPLALNAASMCWHVSCLVTCFYRWSKSAQGGSCWQRKRKAAARASEPHGSESSSLPHLPF